jgi:hypothetical protein
MADDLEALGNILKLFGNIVTEVPQLATAIGTAVTLGPIRDHFALKMFRQRFAFGARPCFLAR